jgi:hypothetical protein
MNSYEFVEVIKLVVRDDSINGQIEQLTKPSGRSPTKESLEMSKWYNELSEPEKRIVKLIISKSVDMAVFGFFCVLDGVRAIEDENKGELELYYAREEQRVLLNIMPDDFLHDIYKGIIQDA